MPNDGAILTEAPKEISIEFVNPAMFTKFEITNTAKNNEKIELSKEFLMVLSDKHSIKLPKLNSGNTQLSGEQWLLMVMLSKVNLHSK